MKHLFIYITLLITSFSSMAIYKNEKPKGVLNATIKDTYTWSEKHQKYSLSSSDFNFTLLANSKEKIILDQNNVTDTPKKVMRFLSVASFKEIQLEYVDSDNQIKTRNIPSYMSKNQGELSIYFSEKTKNDLLNGMLSISKNFSYDLDKTQISSSEYNCTLEGAMLICLVSYVVRDL